MITMERLAQLQQGMASASEKYPHVGNFSEEAFETDHFDARATVIETIFKEASDNTFLLTEEELTGMEQFQAWADAYENLAEHADEYALGGYDNVEDIFPFHKHMHICLQMARIRRKLWTTIPNKVARDELTQVFAALADKSDPDQSRPLNIYANDVRPEKTEIEFHYPNTLFTLRIFEGDCEVSVQTRVLADKGDGKKFELWCCCGESINVADNKLGMFLMLLCTAK